MPQARPRCSPRGAICAHLRPKVTSGVRRRVVLRPSDAAISGSRNAALKLPRSELRPAAVRRQTKRWSYLFVLRANAYWRMLEYQPLNAPSPHTFDLQSPVTVTDRFTVLRNPAEQFVC